MSTSKKVSFSLHSGTHLKEELTVQPPEIFQVQAKVSTIRPVFPDYLSVTYDCGARNLDEYFHFLKYCWSEVQNEGNINKNLNDCMP